MTKLKRINIVELAWAAGFWDGEGSTYVCLTQKKGREYKYPVMSITQTWLYPLQRFDAAVLQIGYICPVIQLNNKALIYDHKLKMNRKVNGKPRYVWRCTSYMQVQAIAALLWPLISEEKRDQIADVLSQTLEFYYPNRTKKIAAFCAPQLFAVDNLSAL